jgi:rare lipoprotein A
MRTLSLRLILNADDKIGFVERLDKTLCKIFRTVGPLACAVFIATGCASTSTSHQPNTASSNKPSIARGLQENRAEVKGSRLGPTIVTASWYGPGYDGHRTASGERFDPNRLTAASKTLPLGSTVRVTNLENGRSVNVEVNDRGPHARSRSLDLSPAAAQKIKLSDDGVARVKITPVSKPLSERDLLKLLDGGVYSGRIATLVRERGINFKPTNRDLDLLRQAGADNELERAIAAAHVNTSRIAMHP